MQEVLSRTEDPSAPLRDQEFYELRLYDSVISGEPRYCVREACARWDDEAKQIVWEKEQIQIFTMHQQAKDDYATRRFALAEKGFIYSDMDLF